MRTRLAALAPEVKPMLALAIPVVLGELAWVSMIVIDTMMVGRVGAEALGALSVGRALFMAAGVFGIGMLLGLDTLVSQAFGAGNREDCRHSLVQATLLVVLLTIPLTAIFRASTRLLDPLGVEEEVARLAAGYMSAVGWGLLPLLFHTALRRYLQAINIVRPVMLALVTANLVNALGNWILIFGKLGAPALGAAGAGWATVIALTYMAAFLALTIAFNPRRAWAPRAPGRPAIDFERIRALLALGFPAAIHVTLEIGIFALATLFASRLAPAAVAAHQIALAVASTTFMVPLGVSAAGAVRVGQGLGRGEPLGAVRAGWTALVLAGAFMALAAVALVVFARPLVGLFTADPRIVPIGVALLLIAAAFQLFDGIQVTAAGVLRGAGDTRTPMLLNLFAYWAVALPVAYHLCFARQLGVVGLWIGLSAGLIVAAFALLALWWRKARRLTITAAA